jgi:uncharacterized protein (TIGR02145 family)
VTDARGLCPSGWHVPTVSEWNTLTTFLGSNAGDKMKSTTGWAGNLGGSNSSGFSALPGGSRNGNNGFNGQFNLILKYGGWWSGTKGSFSDGYKYIGLYCNTDDVASGNNLIDYGLSIRCLKN